MSCGVDCRALLVVALAACAGPDDSGEPEDFGVYLSLDEYRQSYCELVCTVGAECRGEDYDSCYTEWSEEWATFTPECFSGTAAWECIDLLQAFVDGGECAGVEAEACGYVYLSGTECDQ